MRVLLDTNVLVSGLLNPEGNSGRASVEPLSRLVRVRGNGRDCLGGHVPEGPLSLDRQNGTIRMRFGFCNPPSRHQEFVKALRRMPALLDLKME